MTRLTPVDVVGLNGGVQAISAGYGHTCAVNENGGVKCWGDNRFGQLGNGGRAWVPHPTPGDVVGLQSGARAVSAGYHHTCAALESDGAECWGANGGALGDGTGTDRYAPVIVVGLTGRVRAISAGGGHTCAVTQDGWVKCWGWNPFGQLGDGTTTTRLTPVDVLVLVFDCGQVTQIAPAECQALLALFESTRGMLWQNRDGWLESPTPCSWQGVTCACEPQPLADLPPPSAAACAVSGLSLADNNLSGPLPAELGELSSLETLDLSRNHVSGPLPAALGGLHALRELRLDHTSISQLPAELGELAALAYLDVSDAGLVNVPLLPELGRLTALRHLNLSNNGLSGPLPAAWGNLAALQYLNLSNNGLSGPLPAAWGNLAALQYLNLSNNRLSGALPLEWGALAALQELQLRDNQLSGPLPAEWRHLRAAQLIDLTANQLSGALPPAWGELSAIQGLGLGLNALSGRLPAEWGQLHTLQWLGLGSNYLRGVLPAEWGALQALEWLNLAVNQLSGPLPPQWGNLHALRTLYLSENQLRGGLPAEWGELRALRWCFLDHNHLTGPLPPAWGQLTAVYQLNLSYNHLSGRLPAEWGNLASLRWLNLGSNQLSGPLPVELGNLRNALSLRLNNNHFSGPIPPELGNVGPNAASAAVAAIGPSAPAPAGRAALTPLARPAEISRPPYVPERDIDLCCNRLSGPVPREVWRLTRDYVLDFSGNQLSGAIATDALGRWDFYVQYNMFTNDDAPRYGPPNTQTLPPTDLQALTDADSVTLTWTPIRYIEHGGFYEISYATAPDGPFIVHGHTADKTVGSYTVTGLPPGVTYHFRVRTFTPAHSFSRWGEWQWNHEYYQQNDLWSDYVTLTVRLAPVQLWLPLVVQ